MDLLLDEDDDERVLEAALSFVDEFATDKVPVNPQKELEPRRQSWTIVANQEAPPSGSKMSRNERKKLLRQAGIYADPNRARNQRRREAAILRNQVEQLQLNLQVLQRGRKARKGPTDTDALVVAPQIPSMWQQIATQQRRRRVEVESENARLKLVVERQQKVADDLSNSLQRKARQLSNECSSLAGGLCTNKYSIVKVLDSGGDIGDFQQLFRRLDAARQEVDVVFAANGLSEMVATPSDIHIRQSDDGKFLEAFSNKLLAFRLNAVTEAVWSHFRSLDKHAGNGSLYEKTEKYLDESNTIMEAFTMEMHSNSSRADIKVRQIIRRFVEADRDIVIWVSRVSPVEIKHKMLRGLTYHLRGHAIAKRSPASTPGNEVSQLQFCSLISFDQEAQAMYDPESVRAVLNFLIVNTARKMKVHQDRIENLLVEQVLHRTVI